MVFSEVLSIVFNPLHFLIICFGALVGMILGAIPGLSGGLAITICLPMTFSMDKFTAICLLCGIWIGSASGSFIGSITQYKSSNKFKNNYEGHAEFDVVIAKQPAGSAGFGMATGGSNMMILNSATETQKKVAAAFFEYLAQDANVAEWNSVSGYEAFTESVVNDASFKATTDADPNLLNIYKFVEDAHSRPATPKWQEMYSTVIIQDLVDLTQHPENYADPKATQALVEKWAEKCQKILDEK